MIFQAFSIDVDFEYVSTDLTSCKAHQSANGGEKSGNKAVGISRGGRNTKIHASMDGLGNSLGFCSVLGVTMILYTLFPCSARLTLRS